MTLCLGIFRYVHIQTLTYSDPTEILAFKKPLEYTEWMFNGAISSSPNHLNNPPNSQNIPKFNKLTLSDIIK